MRLSRRQILLNIGLGVAGGIGASQIFRAGNAQVSVEELEGNGNIVEPLRIAVVGNMSGSNAVHGAELFTGAETAMRDINASGGIFGNEIQLILQDDMGNPDMSAIIADQLFKENIRFVIGHNHISTALSALPVYKQLDMLYIAPSLHEDAITMFDEDAFIYRMTPSDAQMRAFLVERLALEENIKIALVHTAEYENIAQEISTLFREKEKPLTYETIYENDNLWINRLARVLNVLKPDFIIGAGGVEMSGNIIRAIREIGLTTRFVGLRNLHHNGFWDATNTYGQDAQIVIPSDPRNLPGANTLVDRYARVGIIATPDMMRAYAAVEAIYAAARRTGNINAMEINAEFKSGRRFESILGIRSFREDGNLEDPAISFGIWRNGNLSTI